MNREDYKRKKHKKFWLYFFSPILIPLYLVFIILGTPITYVFWLLNIGNSNKSFKEHLLDIIYFRDGTK